MPVLYIEHPITEFSVWQDAFGRFADTRAKAGVRAERIYRTTDGSQSVIIELDFDTVIAAQQFQDFLQGTVWSTPTNSPALAGPPQTRILERLNIG